MKDNNCTYCIQSELVAKFGYPVCVVDTGYLYIFKERSRPGRVILAYKDHVSRVTDVSDEKRNAFSADVARVARVIHKIYKPGKVNYDACGDTGCRLHIHIIPKYDDGDEWGGTFWMSPDKVYLTDDGHEVVAEQIRAAL